jgi:hypothetical protein
MKSEPVKRYPGQMFYVQYREITRLNGLNIECISFHCQPLCGGVLVFHTALVVLLNAHTLL